ncbi:ribonuclease HIII [bacterium]|nr:ribonuclease HIII [bacterium]
MNAVLKLTSEEITRLEDVAASYDSFPEYKEGYILFSLKIEKINFTLYKSGKLVIQGKDDAKTISLLTSIKTAIFADVDFDVSMTGSDEAGKGDVFGPLVIAAVYCDNNILKQFKMLGIGDSKKFSDEKISSLSLEIIKIAPYSIMLLEPSKYNELYDKMHNLNRMLSWAHHKVNENLKSQTDFKLTVIDDFGMKKKTQNWIRDNLEVELRLETKSEDKYPAVAAASILARARMVEWFKGKGLPKGASNVDLIKQKIIEILEKDGIVGIKDYAKYHFSTVKKIVNEYC